MQTVFSKHTARFLLTFVFLLPLSTECSGLAAQNSFNYERYTPKTIAEITSKIATHHNQQPGISFYTEAYRVQINLPGYPTRATADDLAPLRMMAMATSFGAENVQRFGSVLHTTYDNFEITYLFQDVLVPPLRAEVQPGQSVELYVMLGIVASDPKSKTIHLTLLVNEFKTVPKSVALIDAKADVNLQSNTGTTAIFWAAQSGHPEIIKLLLAASADGGLAANGGVTPIMIAAKKGHLAVIQLLVAAGCDPRAKAANGATARDIAQAYNQSATVQYLDGLAKEE